MKRFLQIYYWTYFIDIKSFWTNQFCKILETIVKFLKFAFFFNLLFFSSFFTFSGQQLSSKAWKWVNGYIEMDEIRPLL